MEEKNYTVLPLSPDPNLSEDNTKVYFNYFNSALKEKRIHNIAVTGGFGTGKSSLIRSYEQDELKNEQDKFKIEHPKWTAFLSFIEKIRRLPRWILFHCNVFAPLVRGKSNRHVNNNDDLTGRFLYISVGEYGANAKKKEKQEPSEGGPDKQEDITSICAVERRMLLQIFARFCRADLPQTSFRLVPEELTKRLRLIAILFGGFVFAALLLLYHEQLGMLLVAVNSMEGGPKLGGLIMGFLVKYKTLFRFLLSAYSIGFVAVFSVFLCIRILPRIRFHEFTVKGANAELSLEREASESYLDLYSMELVYCLEKLAKKIDHVVVFEDLDRLDPKDCLYIITRLREINNLVNLRLQKNGEPLRFIYAVNDEFLGAVQHEKFFDYILPVIPEMNKRSAAVLFAKKIKDFDEKYKVLDVFPQFETVASCLSDYRLQNTILNEYRVLKELYTVTKATEYALNDSQKNEILAFAIYKNCWPGDYHALRENKSQIFTTDGVKVPDEIKSGKYGKLLDVLASSQNHLLTLHSLYYANFNEEMLAEMCANHWKSAIDDPQKHMGIIAELDVIQKDELECISKVREVFNSPTCFCLKREGREPEYCVPLFRAILNCVDRWDQKDNNWFFVKNQYNTCIKLLASLNSKEDETLKTRFFKLSQEKIKDKNNFYGASVAAINGFKGSNEVGEYSNDELRELCRGMKSIPSSAHIKGLGSDSPESSQTVIKIREGFTASNSTPYFSE